MSGFEEVQSPTQKFWLFKGNLEQQEGWYAKEKIYSCRIYENEVLVRDFIPVKDTNEVACLYDRVENKYYYNKGTGTFTAGGDMLETGTISEVHGTNIAMSTRLRSVGDLIVNPDTSYQLACDSNKITRTRIAEYTANGTFVKMTDGFQNLPFTFTTSSTTKFIRFILNTSTGSEDLVPSDVVSVSLKTSGSSSS